MSSSTLLMGIAILLVFVIMLVPLLHNIHTRSVKVVKPVIISPSYRLGPGGQHLPDVNPHRLGPGGQRWPHPPHLLGPGGKQWIYK